MNTFKSRNKQITKTKTKARVTTPSSLHPFPLTVLYTIAPTLNKACENGTQ